ncbi:MAG: formate dehydrogenase accessory sulfurtransferase FdhD [Tessaracoccus sp.]|uniref:formate dehydrogenase accessory sulfurtransferase FdhD n=1 Tax=Tessaracoccus sp. TaxID=1971211 RepID=UPI001EC5BB48|nr:formate dehydrogenase accessory sulfurtransferase FdhD [Tessaracoccus sp.]MBK7820328.1 formate dehydrogenase accessory sulfurtransferase FdhD [Tessaracoccus sp.]
MGRITVKRPVTRFTVGDDAGATRRPDTLVVEEPLEIRLNGTPLAVTMRTPGDDVDLAHGFLLTEGVIVGPEDVRAAMYCAGSVVDDDSGQPQNTYNVLDVRLADGVPAPVVDPTRNFYTTSSCGVCGKASIEAIEQQTRWPVADDPVRLDPALVVRLPELLRAGQRAFARTGGLHAAGLFRADGTALRIAEDVGRHNAVDKVVGWGLLNGMLPARGCVLVVSGRASFELTQKALMAGIPALAAVSAPSSLAVELAQSAGMTLLGFVRAPSFNAYSGAERLSTTAV